MTEQLIADIIGYAGSILILIALKYVRCEKHNIKTDLLIMIGQIAVSANSFYYGAFPAALLNLAGFIVNIFNLRKDLRKRNPTIRI